MFKANGLDLLDQFKALWDECPALRLLLIPDWPAFEEADRRLQTSESSHRSILLLAFERGHLFRLTSLIHGYLFDGTGLRKNLTKDYRNELRERWLVHLDPLKRHSKSRAYLGKPLELFVAQDLENSGMTIVGLEATGGPCDIIASNNGESVFVEVKFIGTDDQTFSQIENASMSGGISVGFNDPYSASDYLLSRLFEAAKQLELMDGRRIATVVIDDYTSWSIFRYGLANGFIDWDSPKFISSNAKFKEHLDKLRQKYPGLDEEVPRLLDIVDDIRIYRLVEGFELQLKLLRTRTSSRT